MSAKRKTEITLLNVLFCLLVIFIHINSYNVAVYEPCTAEYNIAMISWRLASFVVQGFILLSGVKLFLNGKDSMPYHKYLLSRLRGVILPYAICFAFYYVFYIAVYGYSIDIGFILKHFSLGSLVSHFYFVPVIFQFDLLLPIWKRVINNCNAVIVIPFTLLITTICESYMPNMISIIFPGVYFSYNSLMFTSYLAFWIIGCYIGKHYDEFINLIKRNFKTVCVIFAVSLTLCVYFSILAYNYLASVPFMNNIHYLYTVCAILFLFAIAVKVPSGIIENFTLAQKIDRVSYSIYLWHMLILFVTDFALQKLGVSVQILSFFIRAITVYGVTLSACILLRSIKDKLIKNNKIK